MQPSRTNIDHALPAHMGVAAPEPPPPPSQPAPGSAFGAHGIWTPGVLLMRRLRFAPKMVLLMLVMGLAVAAPTVAYLQAAQDQIAFSDKERDGLRYLQAAYPVLLASLDVRRDASLTASGASVPIEQSRAQLQQALQTLEQAQQRLGQDLDTGSAFAAVQQSLRNAQIQPGQLQATFASFSAAPAALIDLIVAACDGSNLTLDPELHTYNVMDALCFKLPDLIERTGTLRGLGSSVLRSGQASNEQRDQLAANFAIVQAQLQQLKAGLGKTLAQRGELSTRIRLRDAESPVSAFLSQIKTDLLQAETLQANRAGALVSAGNVALQALNDERERLLPLLDELLVERIGQLQQQFYWVLIGIVTMVALAAYFAYCFYRVNREGTELIQHHLKAMAEGDLRQPPPPPCGTDEPALIIRDMRVAYDALHSLIRKVRHAARDLVGASEEIAHASRDLGARTEATAASLEQQASAMEQIGAQTRHNAESAQQAAQVSQQNAAVAADGQQVVEAVVGTMHDIQDGSRRIADITNVIDSIAFQTNILALNAAVEAARAGEAGRGFAVVAAEVRSLAQRSAEAAKQIKALIDESVAKVDNGARVVQQAGNTMGGLVENAQKINDLMAEIATAAREQASGVNQSVQGIQQLDASTQQNAALVEQTSAAATALEQQAQRLMEEIARFRL